MSEPRAGQKFAFIMDTRLCDAAFELADGADMLVCESTFADADAAMFGPCLLAAPVLRDGAPKVEIIHWFLQRPHGWVGARYAAGDRGELEERLAARVRSARERGFSVSDNPWRGLCETCPGRAGLCSWSEAQTLRETPARRGCEELP